MADFSSPWDVLLIGGASGVGKTRVCRRLAERLMIPLAEVDDLHAGILAMTTAEQQPMLHYWSVHPDASQLSPERIVELQIEVAQALEPALEAVVANHLQERTPLILEGDYLLPSFAARPNFAGILPEGRVRAVFLYETDEGQIVQNLLAREPHKGPQTHRAHCNRLYSERLREDAERLSIASLPARPWDTLADRIIDSVRGERPAEILKT